MLKVNLYCVMFLCLCNHLSLSNTKDDTSQSQRNLHLSFVVFLTKTIDGEIEEHIVDTDSNSCEETDIDTKVKVPGIRTCDSGISALTHIGHFKSMKNAKLCFLIMDCYCLVCICYNTK